MGKTVVVILTEHERAFEREILCDEDKVQSVSVVDKKKIGRQNRRE